MRVTAAEIEEILEALAETPRRLASMTGDLEQARLHTKADTDSWSANDILAHLRSCADVWGKSIQAMIAQDNPTLRYVSPRTWIRKTDYPTQEFQVSFRAFAGQRDDLLALLKPLALEGWSRAATFTGTTRGREQTVFSYARRIAMHERDHLEQLAGVVGAART
jgi:hypothetical protein